MPKYLVEQEVGGKYENHWNAINEEEDIPSELSFRNNVRDGKLYSQENSAIETNLRKVYLAHFNRKVDNA